MTQRAIAHEQILLPVGNTQSNNRIVGHGKRKDRSLRQRLQYAYVFGDPMKHKDPTGHGVLKLLPLMLMYPSGSGRSASLGRTVFSASDELSGWTMHSAPATGTSRVSNDVAAQSSSTVLRTEARNTPGNGVSEMAGSAQGKIAKKVDFNPVTTIKEYKQRMGPEHWTTRADEKLATKEYLRELEQPTVESPVPVPRQASSQQSRSSSSPGTRTETPTEKIDRIRRADKKSGDRYQ
jgi:hypothetical protein